MGEITFSYIIHIPYRMHINASFALVLFPPGKNPCDYNPEQVKQGLLKPRGLIGHTLVKASQQP